MIYTSQMIRAQILDWVRETEQNEVRYLVPWCLGRYGYVSRQIWRVITELVKEDILTW